MKFKSSRLMLAFIPLLSFSMISCEKKGNDCDYVIHAKSNSPVSSGSNIELRSTFNGNDQRPSYQWEGPNGFSSNEANPVIVFPGLNASGTYKLTVKNASCTKTDTVNVKVSSVTAPCSPSNNSFSFQSVGTYKINYVDAGASGGNQYEVTGNSSSADITVRFKDQNPPTSGLYRIAQTPDDFDWGPRDISIHVNMFDTYWADSGNVYVDVKNGVTSLTWCNMKFNGPSLKLTGEGKMSW